MILENLRNNNLEAAPRLCRPFLFSNPPPAKNQNGEGRQGERAGRAVLRAWRGSALARNRSVRCDTKPPRTRSVRSHWLSKKVRAKDMITPQIETSSSERAVARRDAGAACDNSSRRSAANWLGGGNPKWADLSLVSYLKAI